MSDDHSEPVEVQIPSAQPIRIVGSAANYPSVYADACLFATRLGSTVRLTFVENVLEAADSPDPGIKARHVGTLVMPYEGYKNMLEYLTQQASQFIDLLDTPDGE